MPTLQRARHIRDARLANDLSPCSLHGTRRTRDLCCRGSCDFQRPQDDGQRHLMHELLSRNALRLDLSSSGAAGPYFGLCFACTKYSVCFIIDDVEVVSMTPNSGAYANSFFA